MLNNMFSLYAQSKLYWEFFDCITLTEVDSLKITVLMIHLYFLKQKMLFKIQSMIRETCFKRNRIINVSH